MVNTDPPRREAGADDRPTMDSGYLLLAQAPDGQSFRKGDVVDIHLVVQQWSGEAEAHMRLVDEF